MQYEYPITSGKKVMVKVKVFDKKVTFEGQSHEEKITLLCEKSCHTQYTCAI